MLITQVCVVERGTERAQKRLGLLDRGIVARIIDHMEPDRETELAADRGATAEPSVPIPAEEYV